MHPSKQQMRKGSEAMSYKFFENKMCEFYPCHKAEQINCLFCFCPLYTIDCGGSCETVIGKDGKQIKDCSNCLLPHLEGGYEYVIKRLNGENKKKTER